MFASKLVKFVKKCPRSHLIALKSVQKCYVDKKEAGAVSNTRLLEVYNLFASKMAIDRI